MQTNFFNQIAKMDINSKLILTIAKANESQIVASILVQNDGCGDKAKNIIPPPVSYTHLTLPTSDLV